MKVAITGVGGAAGMSCIKALPSHVLYGFDCNPLSAGFKFVGGYIVPPAESPTFFDVLVKLCRELEIDVLIPTVDEELPIIAERRDELPCVAIVAPLRTVKICLDKRRLMRVLGKNVPKVVDGYTPSSLSYPVVVKPAQGRGSKNIFVCMDGYDVSYAVRNCPKPIIVQEYLSPPEYSVDTLSDLKGRCLVAVPRERIEVKGGVVWRGRTVEDAEVRRLAEWTVERLGMTGPAVVQMRSGKIFEVNPRLGGTTILSVEAGVNIPEFAVKLFMGEELGEIPTPKRVQMARYFEEAYF